uniref:Bursicon subunit alpha n=1 Tax=Panagrellus redivivus TaxID=6233 RepID=A0A7E4W015_PANRE
MRYGEGLFSLWLFGLVFLSIVITGNGQLVEVRTWQGVLPPAPPNYKFVPFGEAAGTPPTGNDGRSEVTTAMPKFWTLVPLENPTTAVTTVRSTVQTTTSTTTTTQPTTTTTPCEYYDDTDLMEKLRERGLYNAIYMATDVFTAANTFPDLGDRTFTMSNPTYDCDQTCQRQANLARRVMASKSRQSIHRPPDERLRRERFRGPRVTEPPRSWWRPNDWRHARGKRDVTRPQPRRKRSAAELVSINSGQAENILGTTIALQCDDATEESVPNTGYHLCRNCRAIRQLSDDFFPRVLNEVICAEGDCLRGDGKCRQRFLPFKILKNFGDQHCPRWREVEINIRTCCDCVIHPNSPFLKYILPPD